MSDLGNIIFLVALCLGVGYAVYRNMKTGVKIDDAKIRANTTFGYHVVDDDQPRNGNND